MLAYHSASGSVAEDLFIELFSEAFGAEKAGYLYSQYHFYDIYQNSRYADFVLENGARRVAIEIDDETSHNKSLVASNKFYDDLLKQNSMVHANQLPYHTMAQTSPYMWSAPYHDFENNYAGYWTSRYPTHQQQYEQQCRQNFKAAIDTAAHATKVSSPVASIVFDSVGLMTADNLVEAVIKTLSIIDKARKL